MSRSSLFAPLSWIPQGAYAILHELTRHLLKRPVVGVCVVGTTPDGRILLVRRGDTGEWALPGGTLEWGETLTDAIPREVAEETGATVVRLGQVTGVYSRPDRDLRFHAVTICVACDVREPVLGPKNKLEIWEARLFEPADVPEQLAFDMQDMLRDAQRGEGVALE